MTREEFLKDYWKYYLLLETKFTKALNYVALSTENYSTYSFEFVNHLFLIGSELDVVMKMMSGFNATDRKIISDYAPVLLGQYPNITNQEVNVQGLDNPIKPFDGWNTTKPSDLKGWEAYNKVKHGRVANLKEATLENVLNLIACLYVLNMLQLRKIADENNDVDIADTQSSLFELKDWDYKFISARDTVYKCIDKNTVVINGGEL